ncbi:UPF0182 family protein [Patescibacteria group bacterium]
MTRIIMKGFAALVCLVILGWIALEVLGFFHVNGLWFASLEYEDVFWNRVGQKWSLFLSFFCLTLIALLASQLPAAANFKKRRKIYIIVAIITSVVIAAIFGSIAIVGWQKAMLYHNAVEVDRTDPIFNQDIGYFFFDLPYQNFISLYCLIIWLIIGVIVTIWYMAINSDEFSWVTSGNTGWLSARIYYSLFLLGYAILYVIRNRLAVKKLALSTMGAVAGAGYTDLHCRMSAYNYMPGILLGFFLVIFWSIWSSLRKGREHAWGKPIFILCVFFLLHACICWIWPGLYQYFKVKPNELTLETPYIERNMEFTKYGFDLEDLQLRDFSVQPQVPFSELKSRSDVIDNIRITDWRALLSVFNQYQELRPYYSFDDVDIDRYLIDGKLTQIMLAPRDLKHSELPKRAQKWVNYKMVYTHGYGICVSRVNDFNEEGLPNLIVKDIPVQSECSVFQLTRPELYFSEVQELSTVYVNTGEQEFDHPQGEENAYCRYEGQAGFRIGSGWNRFLLWFGLNDFKLLISPKVTPESKALINRNVMTRMQRIAPFLTYDDDPYTVAINGRLYSFADGYTSSSWLPYSEKDEVEINYIRNSVKIVTDNYDGTVTFYAWDESDPLLQAWSKAFPELFKPRSEMPAEFLAHVRYPDDLLNVQARVLTAYHMTNPATFIRGEDIWALPTEIFDAGTPQQMLAYYVIIPMDGDDPEFTLILPFTPLNKHNAIAWLCARCDGEHYGEKILYHFPKGELVHGPMQFEAKVDQTEEISKDISLLNTQGSRVIRGNTIFEPVGLTMIYTQPLYVQAEQAKLPQLNRVIVMVNNRIGWGKTIWSAIENCYGIESSLPARILTEPVEMTGKTLAELSVLADQYYRQAQKFAGQGNWTEHGKQMDQLGQVLAEMVQFNQER